MANITKHVDVTFNLEGRTFTKRFYGPNAFYFAAKFYDANVYKGIAVLDVNEVKL